MKRKVEAVPTLRAERLTVATFTEAFERHRAVLVKGCFRPAKRKVVGLGTLRTLYKRHPAVLRRAFNLEQPAPALKDSSSKEQLQALLGGRSAPSGSWYASFVVQRKREALESFLEKLPLGVPSFLQGRSRPGAAKVRHSPAAWVFFGQNPRARPLEGRPEHTDAIAHSGTWHVQLRGSKVWMLRPTKELRDMTPQLRKVGQVKVRCGEGDLLCVSTRLWWHSTYIPGKCPLSMSVARDMHLEGKGSAACDMTNVDGHYATRAIAAGTVVFSEEDAPDLELPRSEQANLEMAEGPNGEMLVVAVRKIEKGEWFSLPESEDEG